METFTHLLLSLALYRAGLRRLTRMALPILLVAGVAPDADQLTTLGRVETWLDWGYTATHSYLGGAGVALAVALAFWAFSGLLRREEEEEEVPPAARAGPAGQDRPFTPRREAPPRFHPGGAIVAALAGVALHILLDVAGTRGVQLLWPWAPRRTALDILDYIDPWIVAALAAGLLLPGLFRLVSEEIGARPAARGAQAGALAALAVVLVYAGARCVMHQRALEVLDSRIYRGAPALRVGAFPSPVNPMVWYGVAETDFTFELVEVQLTRALRFDPARSQTVFKPEASPALEAAQRAAAVRRMLAHARFPSASVVRLREGHQVIVEDLRHAATLIPRRSFHAVVEVSEEGRVLSDELKWGPPRRRR